MNEIIDSTAGSTQSGTNFKKFLADRGVVMVKEFRPIGQFKGRFKDILSFETMLLTIVQGNKKKINYGVRIERQDGDGDSDGSVFLDFDELDELLDAIKFIHSTAKELSSQQRDHTEVSYSSKDEAKVGFYQTSEEQQAFFGLPHSRGTTFLSVSKLIEIESLIAKSKQHLVSCGAV
jgi:hypothetical protein